MSTARIITALSCLLVAGACFTFGVDEQTKTVSLTESDPGWKEFQLESDAYVDNVRIDGAGSPGTVTAIADLSALTSGGDESVFDEFVLSLEGTDSVVTLLTDYTGDRAEQVRLEHFGISVDPTMLVRLRNPNAEKVVVSNVGGGADVIGGSTSIEVRQTGFFTVETGSGSVYAETIAEGDIITNGGNITVDVLEPIPEGELYIESRHGNIDINLPRGYGWVFDFDILESSLDFDVGPESFYHEQGFEYVDRFSVNRGGMLITVISDSGSITIFD